MIIKSTDPDFIKDIFKILLENNELEQRNDNLNLKIVNLVSEIELLKEWLKAYKECLEIILSRA